MKIFSKFYSPFNKKNIDPKSNPELNKKKISVKNFLRNAISKLKNLLILPLHLRIKFRNILPNRYPLTSFLIGLNIFK